MIIELTKMMTGLVVRGGVGALLRLVIAAMMFWAAWLVYAPIVEWTVAAGHGWDLLGGLAIGIPVICGLAAIITGSEGHHRRSEGGYRCPWKLTDFLHRAPFVCWCLMTEDGVDVPLWAILVWPFVAFIEVGVSVWLLVALPFIGLWYVLARCGRGVWRVLDMRPLDRGK